MDTNDTGELNEQEYLDFYQKLRKILKEQLASLNIKKISKNKNAYEILVDYLILLPDLFHLAVKLIFDTNIPPENKGALVAAVVYVVSPIDLIPDTIPIAGWVDDLIVIIIGLNKFFETENDEIRIAVKKYWAGDGDVFELAKHLLSVANSAIEFFPKKIVGLLRGLFN